MKTQILTKRYAQGLVSSIKDDEEYETLFQLLIGFHDLLSDHKELIGALASPFLPTTKKIQITKEILDNIGFKGKVYRFIILLVENNRLNFLPDVIKLVPLLWNERKGITTIEVVSASPLSEEQKRKLKEKLEILEKGPVSLNYKIDPALIGGFSLRKGNIVYDVSVRGSLESLRERISEG